MTLFIENTATVKLNWYSCMGICYAKLFEAAKSMFKSCDSRAVLTCLLFEKA